MWKYKEYTIDEIAESTGGRPTGQASRVISGVQDPEGRAPDRIVICRDSRNLAAVAPGIAVVASGGHIPEGVDGVEVTDVEKAFVRILKLFSAENIPSPGVHASAVIEPGAKFSPSASIGPLCFLNEGCDIGDDVVLEAHVYVGPGVRIGARTRVETHAVLREGTVVGEDCIIHSGAVLGCDGFGFLPDFDNGHIKIPQIGRVRIGDRVEMGACVTIDRATIDETVIGSGTIIDDHVHVGHNARVGENCILVAMTGIAGSSVLKDGVIMAARSGVADHVTVGERAQVAAHGGATKDVPPGATVSGFPARDHREELKKQALLRRLPEMSESVRALRAEINAMKEKMDDKDRKNN
ncbi:MAG: UDP-3-O-(3-hydroxymyristoyl)glucosamine N-acyltransferase [Thermovirga sp.]